MTTDHARALLLLEAARIANDDTAVGDPDAILAGSDPSRSAGVASPSLTFAQRVAWFGALCESTADLHRFTAWRSRTASQHHKASEALDLCVEHALDRASLAVLVLLNGEPVAEAAAC